MTRARTQSPILCINKTINDQNIYLMIRMDIIIMCYEMYLNIFYHSVGLIKFSGLVQIIFVFMYTYNSCI